MKKIELIKELFDLYRDEWQYSEDIHSFLLMAFHKAESENVHQEATSL